MDVLSTMFSYALFSSVLYGVLFEKFGKMCHIQYADDLIILATGGSEDLQVIKLILYLFEGISRLSINFLKTCSFLKKYQQTPDVPLPEPLTVLPVLYS